MNSTDRHIIYGAIAFLLFVLACVSAGNYYSDIREDKCRNEGLSAGRTVDEIVKLCNIRIRR